MISPAQPAGVAQLRGCLLGLVDAAEAGQDAELPRDLRRGPAIDVSYNTAAKKFPRQNLMAPPIFHFVKKWSDYKDNHYQCHNRLINMHKYIIIMRCVVDAVRSN
eukprot:scaffold203863_cov36-Prasinocladus_malaysianus.AAC.1